jgi:hypothetical protein
LLICEKFLRNYQGQILMNQHKKITISFLPHDSDLWDFIENKKETCNLSDYIRSLIRKDMNYDTAGHGNEKVIEKILQLLKNKETIISYEDRKPLDQVPVNEEMKNTINSLF